MDTSGLNTSGLPVPKRLHARSDFLKLEITNANPQASAIRHLQNGRLIHPVVNEWNDCVSTNTGETRLLRVMIL
jgi:hypothetical protein